MSILRWAPRVCKLRIECINFLQCINTMLWWQLRFHQKQTNFIMLIYMQAWVPVVNDNEKKERGKKDRKDLWNKTGWDHFYVCWHFWGKFCCVVQIFNFIMGHCFLPIILKQIKFFWMIKQQSLDLYHLIPGIRLPSVK